MKIALIGSGNIATYFGLKFHQHGHDIVQVISKNQFHAAELANRFNCDHSNSISALSSEAEIYLLAIKDDLLIDILSQLDFQGKTLIHTAGSVNLHDLIFASSHIGSIWCMYSINKNHLPERDDIPLIINATDSDTLAKVQLLSACISNAIYSLNDDQKLVAHLAAVFANNFANHMFTIGQDILKREQISFDLLLPLIENTVDKLKYSSPDKLQTGPAIRHDLSTIEKHNALLNTSDDYKAIYNLLSDSIQNKYKNG